MAWLVELGAFTLKQVRASMFALTIFAGLAVAPLIPLPRYDYMLLVGIAMQWFMIRRGLESRRELGLITGFHVLGLGLEMYKVRFGSWSYPEFAYTKVGPVPLYSGFMYSAVASYILQAWRVFDLEFEVPGRSVAFLAWNCVVAIYANFLGNRIWGDWRWLVYALLFATFGRAIVRFTCLRARVRMPLLVAFGLIGFFVWVAENICSYLHAWQYPDQAGDWTWVHASKISSWAMMVVIAFVIIWRWQSFQPEARTSARMSPMA